MGDLTWLAGCGLAVLSILLGSSCATSRSAPLRRFEYEQAQMGLPFRMVLYAPDRETARSAAVAAFGRIAQLNTVLSDYEDDSELTRLSRTAGTGHAVEVSQDLWRVLERSQALAIRSGGAFDVTVGPVVNLWRRARRQHEFPSSARLAAARAKVGYEKVLLDRRHRTVRLLVPGMKLDLGGIAKGYGVDEALKVLRRHGIKRALVTGGGDMAVWDPPPGKAGWRIELAPLDVTNAPPASFVLLRRMALATSGDLFQYVELAGRRYSHIVDPRTGIGLTDRSLVTVIAPNCTTADSLATTVSVLGPEAGLRLIQTQPGTEVRIVRKPGAQVQVFRSDGFARYLEAASHRPAMRP